MSYKIPTMKKPVDSIRSVKGNGCIAVVVQEHSLYNNEYFDCHGIHNCSSCILSTTEDSPLDIEALAKQGVITKEYALQLTLEGILTKE